MLQRAQQCANVSTGCTTSAYNRLNTRPNHNVRQNATAVGSMGVLCAPLTAARAPQPFKAAAGRSSGCSKRVAVRVEAATSDKLTIAITGQCVEILVQWSSSTAPLHVRWCKRSGPHAPATSTGLSSDLCGLQVVKQEHHRHSSLLGAVHVVSYTPSSTWLPAGACCAATALLHAITTKCVIL